MLPSRSTSARFALIASGVNRGLKEKIVDIVHEPLQRPLSDLLDVFWPAVEPGLFAGVRIKFESELGGDRHLLAEGSKRPTDQFFVDERAVHFRRIEERDA